MRTFLLITSTLPASSPDSKAILEALCQSISFNQIRMVSLLHYLVEGAVYQNTSDKHPGGKTDHRLKRA